MLHKWWLFLLSCFFFFLSKAGAAQQQENCEQILLSSAPQNLNAAIQRIEVQLDSMPFGEALQTSDKLLHIATTLPNSTQAFEKVRLLIKLLYEKAGLHKQYLLYCLAIVNDEAFARPGIHQFLLYDLGSYFHSAGDFQSSEYYLTEYIQSGKASDIGEKINAFTTLGIMARDKENYTMALAYMKMALSTAVAHKNIPWIGLASGNLGDVYFKMKRYSEAVPYLKKDISNSILQNWYESAAGSLNVLAQISTVQNHFAEAQLYLDSSLHLLNKIPELTKYTDARVNNYQARAELLTQENLSNEAVKYYRLAWQTYNDIKAKKLEDAASLQLAQIREEQKKQSEALIATINRRNQVNLGLLLTAIAGLLATVIAVWYMLKQKQKQNNTLQQQRKQVIKENSEISQINNRLVISNETKDKLLAILAHDLRAPVINLQNLLAVFKNGYMEEAQLNREIDLTETRLLGLKDAVDNLLTWALSQTQGITPQPEHVQLKSMVNIVIDFLKESAVQKNIKIVNSVQEDMYVISDATQLEIIMRNLVSNAIKFSYEKGSILITALRNEASVTVSVIDNGTGLTQKKLEEILNNNFQNSAYGTYGEKGIGLGLGIVKDFIARNHGNFYVTHNSGGGSIFSFAMPA